MRNKLIVLVIGIVVFFLASPAYAVNEAGASAVLAQLPVQSDYPINTRMNVQRATIQAMLDKYHSPLAGSVDAFMRACQTYELDCYLLPSIAGLESTFGQYIMPNSHNPFGWGGGLIMFDSWDTAIDTVAKSLRLHYINQGATSVDTIAPIYSESPTWAPRVKNIMSQFNAEEAKNQLLFTRLQVQ